MFETNNHAFWMAGFEVALRALIKAHLAPKPIKQQEITALQEAVCAHTGFPARTEPAHRAWPPPPALGRIARLPSEARDLK